MESTSRSQRIASWAVVPLAILACTIGAIVHVGRSVHAGQTAPASARNIKLPNAHQGSLYALTLGLKDLTQLQGTDSVKVTVNDAQGEVASKWLHPADLDFYLTLRPRAAGPVTVNLNSASGTQIPEISATLSKILQSTAARPGGADFKRGLIAAAPNGSWQNAQPFELGQTIFGSDDERPYAPSKSEDGYAAMVKGFQWFRFTFREKQPRACLLRAECDRPRRAIRCRHLSGGQRLQRAGRRRPIQRRRVRLSGRGDPELSGSLQVPHPHSSARPGILRAGSSESPGISVAHLSISTCRRIKTRTRRCALAWTFSLTWATPGCRIRPAEALSPCAPACSTRKPSCASPATPHSSHSRGYLKAVEKGYAPTQRPSLEFITDRIYNNARPLYGEPNTNWVRIIYTARTVSSRLPMIAHAFEQNVTHDKPRKNFDLPYAEFLKIHYKGVTVMPGDEAGWLRT